MNHGQDFGVSQVVDHNETLDWCRRITKDCEYMTYRPNVGILQSRNAYMHDVMHYRSHQKEV